MPLTAREILNKVDLPDTDANRRYLQRKVDECPEIKKSGENKGRTYCTKRLVIQEEVEIDALLVSRQPVEQPPPSPLPTDQPVLTAQDVISDLCERAERNKDATVDYDALNPLIEAIPADLSQSMTDEIRACFSAHPSKTVITASYFESEDVEPMIHRVISALAEVGLSPAWEFGGDLVFLVDDRSPEKQALPIRKIMLQEGGDRSIRLRRGTAWGCNDWKFNGFMYIYHTLPDGWDESWWTG